MKTKISLVLYSLHEKTMEFSEVIHHVNTGTKEVG
jgi:hypothetical protein